MKILGYNVLEMVMLDKSEGSLNWPSWIEID